MTNKWGRGRAYVRSASQLSTSPHRPVPHGQAPINPYVMTCVCKLCERLHVTTRGMKPEWSSVRGVGEQCHV